MTPIPPNPNPRSRVLPTTHSSTSQYSPLHQFRLPCSAIRHILRHIIRRLLLRIRLFLLLILSFPVLLYFLASTDRSLVLNFIATLAFASTLLLLLSLSFHLLPPFRLLLTRSSSLFPPRFRRRSPPPVLWSIGGDDQKEKGKSSSVTKNCPLTGLWVQVYSNGDVYEGEFHRGKISGSGVYYYYMSGRYEGDWIDEKYDGYGVETWARGSRYRGQYRKGLRHGFGIYRFYTGDVYAGEWSNGQSHGSGVHTCEDGSRYLGEFKWGLKHGLGHYHFRNGDTYAGEYFADKMHGFGTYGFANGHRYEGAWHEGRRQGLGMYSFRNGETQAGHWQNGVLDTSSTHNTFSGSYIGVDNSKVLHAVQARSAAEKALNQPKVDVKVNRAVAFANKAAIAARVAAVNAAQKGASDNREYLPTSIV
ncbi:hypothetical protein ZOSMA_23G00320 [Zostera marina]|uniref:Uncharacterized protein n=1 Tax=Zostera marina TaxID=29655 RepID=A0A0K9PJF9_ZOSMR|nr:hypothetical protein ZOSMA_23G00320 [Zostera marina]